MRSAFWCILLLSLAMAQPVIFTFDTENAVAGENVTVTVDARAGEPSGAIQEGDFIDVLVAVCVAENCTEVLDHFLWKPGFEKVYSITHAIPQNVLKNVTWVSETEKMEVREVPRQGNVTTGFKRFDKALFDEDTQHFIIFANKTEMVSYFSVSAEVSVGSEPAFSWVWAIPLLSLAAFLLCVYVRQLKWGLFALAITVVSTVLLVFL